MKKNVRNWDQNVSIGGISKFLIERIFEKIPL